MASTVEEQTYIWAASLEQKRDALQTAVQSLERKHKNKYRRSRRKSTSLFTLDKALQVKDLASFQHAVENVVKDFKDSKVTAFVADHLYPRLSHVRSFKAGISSATQYEPTASLAWGALLIVIQCGCIFAESLEEIVSELETLEDLLPILSSDRNLYPTRKDLQDLLRDLYGLYIEYCLVIIRHLSKSSLVLLVKGFVSSSLAQALKKTKQSLEAKVKIFNQAVGNAERERAIQAQLAHNSLQAPPLSRGATVKTEFPIHVIGRGRNEDFLGRDKELEMLSKFLVKEHTDAKPLSYGINGFGGLGKTETASEFAHRHTDDFDAVFFVSADPEKKTEALRTFVNIGRRLQMFDTDEISDAQVDRVKQWLETTDHRWLIVFDNVINKRDIDRFWPTTSIASSAIIVTSQTTTPWTTKQLNLDSLDKDTGAEFLLSQLKLTTLDQTDSKWGVAGEISEELGGSPLYLTHAQGVINLGEMTLEQCLETIRTSDNPLELSSDTTWRYERAVSATHDKILEFLTPGAKDLLFMLAFMSPDELSDDLIFNCQHKEELEFLSNKTTYRNYTAELVRARLVVRDQGNMSHRLRIHRATQFNMFEKLQKDIGQRDLTFRRVIRLLRTNFPDPSPSAELHQPEAHVWPHILKILPHLMYALHKFELRLWPKMPGTLPFARLLSDVAGMTLYDRGRIAETYRINWWVEKILAQLEYPANTRLMADVLAMIGLCSDFMGLSKRQEGLEIRLRCEEISLHCFSQIPPERVTSEDRIWLYNSYTDLVCSQQQFNDFANAEENLNHCLDNYKQWGDEEKIPYEYSKFFNQMAYILLYQNKSAEAVRYAEKGYDLLVKAKPHVPMTVLYKFDYANILFQHGKQTEALETLKELLKDCERDYGKENVLALAIGLNIGIMCYFLKDLDGAKEQITKAVRFNNTESWPKENTVRGKYYLSQVLIAQDSNGEEGHALETEAKKELEELLEADTLERAGRYRDDLPMLFDYLVHWEFRLVTPRSTEPVPVPSSPDEPLATRVSSESLACSIARKTPSQDEGD